MDREDGRKIDLHCHILPGVDDGAQTWEDALTLAQMAVDSGVSAVVATPHSHRAPRFATEVEGRVRALQYRLRCENIPLRVLPGMEIFMDEDTPRALAAGELLPLCGTRYALVEAAFDEDPFLIDELLQGVLEARFVPVVAHPERYFCLQRDPSSAARWRRMGCLLQVNKGSLLGQFGDEARRAAESLLWNGAVSVVSSDAHSPFKRTTDMRPIAQYLDEVAGGTAERLLCENPLRLLADKPPLDGDIRRMTE